MVPYGAPAPGGSQQQPYPGAPPQQAYGQQQYGASPFDQPGGIPPQPVQTAPTSITPMAQASPSTLGFASPQPDFAGFQSPGPSAPGSNQAQYGGNQNAPNQQYGGADQFAQPPPQQKQPYGGVDQFAQPPQQQNGGGGDPFSQQPPQQQNQPFGGGDQFAQPPQQQNQPYGGGDQFAQPPQQQNQPYGGGDQFAQPPPHQQQQPPSQQHQQNQQYSGGDPFTQPPQQQNQDSFSVASGQQFGADQGSQFGDQQQQQQQSSDLSGGGHTLTMNSLQGQDQGLLGANGNTSNNKAQSLADQAYAKFASMDQFDLVSKKEVDRANPFESAPVGQQKSLADMQKQAKVCLYCYSLFIEWNLKPF